MYKLHKWLGMITGIPLLLISLTGSILLFRPELEQLTIRQAYQVKPAPQRISIEDQLESARTVAPVDYP
jgi:uncharacterized iron-regulated membrane protein